MTSKVDIETPRLLLRTWKEVDIEAVIQLNADPRVMQYFPSTMSALETMQMMQRIKDHFREWGYGLWAAELKEDQRIIGFIGLSHPRFEAAFTPCVEIGWRIIPQYWNIGLATEGAKAVLDYAFTQLKLSEIYSWTPISNKPSERVMQKIGMSYQDTFKHPNLPADNALSEHVIYKMEKEDWSI